MRCQTRTATDASAAVAAIQPAHFTGIDCSGQYVNVFVVTWLIEQIPLTSALKLLPWNVQSTSINQNVERGRHVQPLPPDHVVYSMRTASDFQIESQVLRTSLVHNAHGITVTVFQFVLTINYVGFV
jgi:hypothetical protein